MQIQIQQTTVPPVMQQTGGPSATQQTGGPSVPQQTGGPSATQQTGAPSVPQQTGVQPVQQQSGSVIVMIVPPMAAQSGAMWRVENGTWNKSGDTVSNLPVGLHTIEFQDIGNRIKPENQKVMIEAGQTFMATGIYNNK
jgi:hypothetical protein